MPRGGARWRRRGVDIDAPGEISHALQMGVFNHQRRLETLLDAAPILRHGIDGDT